MSSFACQWATSALASSQYDFCNSPSNAGAACDATGAADVNACSDSYKAWIPSSSSNRAEWLQLGFAGLLCAAQPETPYALALYHTILTAAGVGSEVQAATTAAKVVLVFHILVSVGTLSAIFTEAGQLHTERKKAIERLQMMLRKSDPLLIQQLHLWNWGCHDVEYSASICSLMSKPSEWISSILLRAVDAHYSEHDHL